MKPWIASSVLLLLVPVQAGDLGPTNFASPAHFDGATSAEDLEWILLVIPPHTSWNVSLTTGAGHIDVVQRASARADPVVGYDLVSIDYPLPGNKRHDVTPATQRSTGTTEGWALMQLRGNLSVTGVGAGLTATKSIGDEVRLDPEIPRLSVPPMYRGTQLHGAQLHVEGSASLTTRATHLAYHNMTLGCPSCPQSKWHETHDSEGADIQIHRFHEIESDILLKVDVARGWILAAWLEPATITLDGSIRLPEAQDGQTLRLEGLTTLRGLHATTAGKLAAQIDGNWTMATIDEDPAPHLLATRVPTNVGAAGIGFLIVLGWFISRQLIDSPFEHPLRRRIRDLLTAHHGLGFQDIRQALGIGNGSLHYHLYVLLKSGHVSTTRDGASRVYHLVGVEEQTAVQSKMLRKPAFRELHELIVNRAVTDKRHLMQVVVEELGIPRTTANYRLKRLEEVGLITYHSDGTLALNRR